MTIQSNIISTHEKKRVRGQPLVIMQQVFFNGAVYMIEEEIYSDADHSSVYTSEDSFEEDETLQKVFTQQNQILVRQGTPGSIMNSMKSIDQDGFIEHKENLKNAL